MYSIIRSTTPVALSLLLLTQLVCGFYSAGGPVVELTDSNFENKVKSGGVWLVEFYAPWCGHCQSLKPAWEQTATALKGIVNVGAVDADTHKSVGGQFNVRGFPTIKFVFVNEKGKIKSVDFNGGRDAASLINFAIDKAKAFALKKIGQKASGSNSGGAGGRAGGAPSGGGDDGGFYKGTDVVTLTDDNFDQKVVDSDDLWFVEFYAPWCGHCKNLKPEWIAAATELKGKVKVGAIDCTVHQAACGRFQVRGYPTIKFFGLNKDNPEDYEGGRTSSSIAEYGISRWGKLAPPPEVVELRSQSALEEGCTKAKGGAKQLCFLAFLPNILDTGAKGRNAYIHTLKEVAEHYKDRPFSYLWVEGGAQSALENNFGVGGFGYPALIAFNPTRGSFSTLKSAFETAHVTSWVERIRRAGETVVPVSGDLATVETKAAWDGQDAQVQEEEEFDLSDIMNEEL